MMKCRLVIGGPTTDTYLWILEPIKRGASAVCIEACCEYKRPATARLAAKRWAARHNIEIVEEVGH